MIEVKYCDFPVEASWTLRDSAGTLVAGQSTGSFTTDDGAVSKTTYTAEGAHHLYMTDTCGDGIRCQYGAGKIRFIVNGEPAASSGEFGLVRIDRTDFFREDFDVYGGDCRVSKNHSLRDSFAELSDLFTNVFHEACRLPTGLQS
jgi:hypothetical protein